MKKGFIWTGMLAASMAVGGLTAYGVTKVADGGQSALNAPGNFASGVANHFTSYEPNNYPDLTYAAENAVQAVVNIVCTQEVSSSASMFDDGGGFDPFREFFGLPGGSSRQQQQPQAPQERKSGGSGVIISADGYIVTNNHVVDGVKRMKVTLNDKRTFDAKLIGTDPNTEVALIKIDAKDLPTLPMGNSDALRLGEWVLAIGSPYGLQSTITAGIVSAKGRSLGALDSQYRLESFIQTDAAVNPGNSGGALVNTKGELVGINTLIQSQTGSYIGYSFAVPVEIVKKVVGDLKEYGVVQRALLGISYREIDDEFLQSSEAKEAGIKETGGIYVGSVVDHSAASEAGIKKGDVLTEIDGVQIHSTGDLSETIAKHRPGDKVKITVKRDGAVKQMEATLRNKTGDTKVMTKDVVSAADVLKGQFVDLPAGAKKSLKVDGGALVAGVGKGGLLEKAGIRAGSVITKINGQSIREADDLNRINSVESVEWVNPDGSRDRVILMAK